MIGIIGAMEEEVKALLDKTEDIHENKILDLVNIENIIRIRNHTQAKYEIEEIANQVSLKGLFAKRILEKIQNTEDEQEKNRLISAFDVGIDVLSK